MPRRGENIYKRKVGRWEGRVLIKHDSNGKTKYMYLYDRSYINLKAKMKDAVSNLNNDSLTKDVYYSVLLDKWLSYKIIRVKESSYAHYLRIVETYLKPHLGKLYLSKINNNILINFMNSLINRDNQLSNKSIDDILTILKSTLKYANSLDYKIKYDSYLIKLNYKEKEMRVEMLCIKS